MGRRRAPQAERKQRLSRKAVNEQSVTDLGDLRHCRDLIATAADCDECRLRRYIVVPHIVVNHLVIPEHLSRGCIQSDQRIGIQILPFAIRAVKIVRGRAHWEEHDAALYVDTHD